MRTFGTIMGSTLFQDENPGDKLMLPSCSRIRAYTRHRLGERLLPQATPDENTPDQS